MQRIDFYHHNGCLSRRSILSLAKVIETAYPRWTVTVHALLEDDLKSLGFEILPTIAINGVQVVSGMPSREWLLETIRMCDQ